MLGDYLKYAVNAITRRGTRSWLTMIGIFIGIAAVVALVSLSQGLQEAINNEFTKVGADRVIITPGGANFGPVASSAITTAKFYQVDVNVVRKVPGVQYAAGFYTTIATKVEYRGEVKYVSMFGQPTDSESLKLIDTVSFLDIMNGRGLRSGDGNRVVLGYLIATDTFNKNPQVGDKLFIEEQPFTIIGIQEKAGTGVHDIIIRIPIEKAWELQNITTGEVSTIMVKTSSGFDPAVVADDITKALDRSRGLKAGEEDFTAQTSQQAIDTLNNILNVMQFFLVGIASISLIVGGVGIMNTMYTAVLERTREIGVMKAVGARNSHVLTIFLIESGLLGLVGGVIGVILGYAISKGVQFATDLMKVAELNVSYSPYIIFGALGFSFVVGSLSGVLPAIQAMRLKPVDALRK